MHSQIDNAEAIKEFNFTKGKPKAMQVDPAGTGGDFRSNFSDGSKPRSVSQPGAPSAIYRNQVRPKVK